MKTSALHQAAQVHYTVSVVNADGSINRKLKRRRNLILDQGLNLVATVPWAGCFTAAAVGTGTTPTKRDSGAVTVSRTGSTLTASAGYFVADDVGRLFKFDTGEEVRITAYTSGTQVTTADSGAIAAAEGTMWYVNQIGLVAETKRSNAYQTSAGSNQSTFAAATWTHKRTFNFSAETGTVTYREIGWSNTTAPGNNLFGRDLLAGAGVTLVATQQLRVTVELSVSYGPSGPVPYSSVVTGWSQSGASGVECVQVSVLDGNGDASAAGALDPSGVCLLNLMSDTVAIVAPQSGSRNLGGQIASVGVSLGSYSTGSFTRTKTGSLSTGTGNSSAIRSIMLAQSGSNNSCARVLLDSAETKLNTQTLSLTFTLTWGRVLDNS